MNNTQVKKQNSRIIELGFCVWGTNSKEIIVSMNKKEAFDGEFFVTVTPNNSFNPIFEKDPIVVKYNGRYYLIPTVADSVIIDKGLRKRYVIDRHKSLEYVNRNLVNLILKIQLIRFNNGQVEDVLKDNDTYRAYFY